MWESGTVTIYSNATHFICSLANQRVQYLTQYPLTPLDNNHTPHTRNPSPKAAMAWHATPMPSCFQTAPNLRTTMSWSCPWSPGSTTSRAPCSWPLPLPAIVGALPADILSSSCCAPQALHRAARPARARDGADHPRTRHDAADPPHHSLCLPPLLRTPSVFPRSSHSTAPLQHRARAQPLCARARPCPPWTLPSVHRVRGYKRAPRASLSTRTTPPPL